jgi:lysophospholipase
MIPAASLFDPLMLAAPGARLRAARFPADPMVAERGVCVLLNGQTEFIEKYFEVIDELRGRGFSVATMDWRGQGGSERLIADARKSFVRDFAEYDDDLDTLMEKVVAPMAAGARPVALAHSMGGHVLLRGLVRKPGRFAACAFSAPMIGISFRGQREWLVRLVTAAQNRRGNREGWVWGMEKRDPFRVTFATQLVTSDPQRFERTQMLLRQQPDMRMAGATWGWLAAAMASIAWLTAPGRAESIAAPLLIAGAGADRICLTPAAKAFAARVPDARFVEIARSGHEILMERDPLRALFWQAFDAFLDEKIPRRRQ